MHLLGYNRKKNFPQEGIVTGVPRMEILKKHFEVMKRPLSDAQWRQEYAPALEIAGLITQEKDGKYILTSPVEDIDWERLVI